jgi:diadenosine tetraphosphate (Ap4A) HIT family hydrolase
MPSNHDHLDTCLLCGELHDRNALSSYLNLYTSCDKKILLQTKSLVLMPDISPIVPGHMLIVTKDHYLSFSTIPEYIWQELDILKKLALNILAEYQYRPFFFEHGDSSGLCQVGGCISHAHLHVIPTRVDILKHLNRLSSNGLSLKKIDMKNVVPKNGCDYLYYENHDAEGCIVVNPNKPLPHQFIRIVVAQEIGIPDWDWRNILISNDPKEMM